MPDAPIGVLGGTFDPVHGAHLALAEAARARLGLARVLWIPAGRPPHRAAPLAPGVDRLAMVRLAVAGHAGFELDDAEVLSDTPSYTVPTLERLRGIHGTERPLVLLTGADAFLGLTTWHRWHEIFALAHLAVASRPGFAISPDSLAPDLAAEFARRHAGPEALGRTPAGAIVTFPLSAGTVSATAVRERLAAGQAVGDWLPPGVSDYIHSHHLYGC